MKIIGGIAAFIIALAILIVAFGSWGTVDAGHVGVVLRFGALTGETKPAGFYTKTPWTESVKEVDCRVEKTEVETEAASKDLQTVTVKLALNMNISPPAAGKIFATYGEEVGSNFVDPALKESMKAVIAQYTAEELITKREAVREGIAQLVRTKLEPAGVITDAVNIVDFQFSKTFNEAIEAKVTAEQTALAAKNKLEQVKYEADQAAAVAKGKAEAIQLEAKALVDNPAILQLRAVEKWNGVLPQIVGTGGAIPFIQGLK